MATNEIGFLAYSEHNHEIMCMRTFIKICYHVDSPVRYSLSNERIKVFYYYNDKDMFDIDKDVKVLQQFVKVSKFDKHSWKIGPVAVKHHTFNYSDIYFTEFFRFMTRLDIIRNEEFMT